MLPARLAVDDGGDRDPGAPAGVRLPRGPGAQAGRGPAEAAPRRHRDRGRPAGGADGARARVPALRGDGQPRCDRPYGVADARHASTAPRMESVAGRGTRPAPLRRHRPGLPACGVAQDDVDRPGDRRGRGDPAAGGVRDRLRRRGADTAPVVRLARDRVVDQPPARSPRGAADDGPDALPSQAHAQDLGVLRDFRRSRGPLAPSGQLAGASGRPRRAPHVADEHGTRAAGERDGLRLRLHPGRATHPAHRRCHGDDDGHGAARGALLQLVRHPVPEAAAASLRLLGGQRQSRGSPDDPASGAAGASRRQDHGPEMVRGPGRHAAGPHRRRGRRGAGAARAPAAGSGSRLRLPARDDRRGAAVARPDRGGRRGGRRARRRHVRRGRRRRTGSCGRCDVLVRCPRPPVPERAGGARVSRPVGRGSRRAWQARATRRATAGSRRLRELAAPRGRACPLPPSGWRRSSASLLQLRRAGPHGVRLSLRQGAPPAGHRVQRRRGQAGSELLRPARLGSEARQFRGDRAGTTAAGGLVRARAPAHLRGGQGGAPVLERLDVRVPDAAPGDARVRQHAARPDLPRDGGPADRLREAARRALGHLGVRLQLRRCEPELPVPRLRRSRPRAEARARGGPRHRALRLGPRADGGARGVVREPAAAGRRRAGRKVRPVRGDRLHARHGCRAASRAPSCARSWRTTRA